MSREQITGFTVQKGKYMTPEARSREQLFTGDYHGNLALSHMPPEVADCWRDEAAALKCSTCFQENCKFRDKHERLPDDAGGEGQCLRWAQEFTPLAWRNVDGRVIVMPQEVLDTIRDMIL